MEKKTKLVILLFLLTVALFIILLEYKDKPQKHVVGVTVSVEDYRVNFPNIVYVEGLSREDYIYNIDTYFNSIQPKVNVLGVLITTGTKFNGRHKDNWHNATNDMIKDILSLHRTILMQPSTKEMDNFTDKIRESASILSDVRSRIYTEDFENDESYRMEVFYLFERYEYIMEQLKEGEF